MTRYVGAHYETTTATPVTVMPLGKGLACRDDASGTAYMKYRVKGYAGGNLSFTANVWDGSYNAGEFSVAGSVFMLNDAVMKTYTLGGQRIATRQTGTLFYVHADYGFADEASGVPA